MEFNSSVNRVSYQNNKNNSYKYMTHFCTAKTVVTRFYKVLKYWTCSMFLAIAIFIPLIALIFKWPNMFTWTFSILVSFIHRWSGSYVLRNILYIDSQCEHSKKLYIIVYITTKLVHFLIWIVGRSYQKSYIFFFH